MTTVLIAPGLTLDDEMFELTRAALWEYAPEEVEGFTRARFIDRKNWFFVPDVTHPEGMWFKAEFAIKHGPPYLKTIRLNVWRAPDLRRDGAPSPHSHPWYSFTGHVLRGGYVEDRYEVEHPERVLMQPFSPWEIGAVSVTSGVIHQAGDNNKMPVTTFHEVVEVLEPGRTLSLMVCSLSRKQGWGYLDPDTGLYTPNQASSIDPIFKKLKLHWNPHLR